MRPWVYGKSPHKFTYTYQDISNLTKLAITTLRIYASKGKFNPDNLNSVIEFVNRYNQTK